jgi:hypothetical protein
MKYYLLVSQINKEKWYYITYKFSKHDIKTWELADYMWNPNDLNTINGNLKLCRHLIISAKTSVRSEGAKFRIENI